MLSGQMATTIIKARPMTDTPSKQLHTGNSQLVACCSDAKLAVVHEWLTDLGGSEAVTAEVLGLWPQARLYALFNFLKESDRQDFGRYNITTTFLQNLPGMHRRFWYWLWLMPNAIESLDLREHDLILSSSHAFAKGVLTNAEQLHVSYVHSPMRYAWDMHHEYMADYGFDKGLKSLLVRRMFSRLRQWDRQTANNVDLFIANSAYVARRIWRTYRRKSLVIHPPVDVEQIPYSENKEDFYLTVSRLVSYKRVDMIVDAFSTLPNKRLLVIGDGPELQRLKQRATPNIEFCGHLDDLTMHGILRRARAFVFAAREDFGITPVEAQAAGTPVIAFGKGGAQETVIGQNTASGQTGIFYPEQTPASLIEGIHAFEASCERILPSACRTQAEHFSRSNFQSRMRAAVNRSWELWQSGRSPENLIDEQPGVAS